MPFITANAVVGGFFLDYFAHRRMGVVFKGLFLFFVLRSNSTSSVKHSFSLFYFCLVKVNKTAFPTQGAIGNYRRSLKSFWSCSHSAMSVCGGLVKAAGVGGRESKKACKSASNVYLCTISESIYDKVRL